MRFNYCSMGGKNGHRAARSGRACALLACSLLLLPAAASAEAGSQGGSRGAAAEASRPLRGRLQLRIATLTERIGSFAVSSRGRLQSTGPVVLELDPRFARAQSLTLDFDRMEIRIETRLLMNAPILRRNGAGPTPIAVSERGPFRIVAMKRGADGRTASLDIDYRTTSSGTIGTGPFQGAAYKNKKDHNHDCRYPANTVRNFVVNLDSGGNVVGASPSARRSDLLCAADMGSFTFSGRTSEFNGTRSGTIAPMR